MNATLSLEGSGLSALRRRLRSARARARRALVAATAEAMQLVFDAARDIIGREVYGKPRPANEIDPPDKSDAESLYASFFQELSRVASSVAEGVVGNTAEHAAFLEFGTSAHVVPKIRGGVFHFLDAGGGDVFARSVRAHEVAGIEPIRFLERALHDNRGKIEAIYRDHFEGLFG